MEKKWRECLLFASFFESARNQVQYQQTKSENETVAYSQKKVSIYRMTWNGMKFNLFWYFVFNVSREIYKETLNYYFIYSCSRLNFLDGMNFFVYILLIDGLLEWNGINRDNVYVISKNELMGIFCQTKLKRAYETNSIPYKSSTKTIFYFSALHISADEKFVRYDTYEWCAAHENHCNYCYHKIIQHNHR